jgi:hypothetical protein
MNGIYIKMFGLNAKCDHCGVMDEDLRRLKETLEAL